MQAVCQRDENSLIKSKRSTRGYSGGTLCVFSRVPLSKRGEESQQDVDNQENDYSHDTTPQASQCAVGLGKLGFAFLFLFGPGLCRRSCGRFACASGRSGPACGLGAEGSPLGTMRRWCCVHIGVGWTWTGGGNGRDIGDRGFLRSRHGGYAQCLVGVVALRAHHHASCECEVLGRIFHGLAAVGACPNHN